MKTINLKKWNSHKQLQQSSFQDDVESEIYILKEISKLQAAPNAILGADNIVQFKFCSRDATNMYIYQEAGNDLFNWVSRNYSDYYRKWTKELNGVAGYDSVSPYEKQAKMWCRDLALGLKFLHDHGIAHRDVKLQNAIVVDGTAKLIDFGVARYYGFWDPEMKTKAFIGTPEFLSPEAYFCGKSKRASYNGVICDTSFYYADLNDVWAYGILVFSLLMGCPPYQDIRKSDTRFSIITNYRFEKQTKTSVTKMNTRDLLKQWNKELISDDALDFLARIFVPQSERPCFDQLLKHQWLTL